VTVRACVFLRNRGIYLVVLRTCKQVCVERADKQGLLQNDASKAYLPNHFIHGSIYGWSGRTLFS
jgi:hypothetical protein